MYFRQGLGAGRAPTQAFLIIGVAGPPSINNAISAKMHNKECVISIVRGLETQKLSEANLQAEHPAVAATAVRFRQSIARARKVRHQLRTASSLVIWSSLSK
jgi:hypothetical protein